MNEHIKAFEQRLIRLFENKAAEFAKYSEENPQSAVVSKQLARLYAELVEVLQH